MNKFKFLILDHNFNYIGSEERKDLATQKANVLAFENKNYTYTVVELKESFNYITKTTHELKRVNYET